MNLKKVRKDGKQKNNTPIEKIPKYLAVSIQDDPNLE